MVEMMESASDLQRKLELVVQTGLLLSQTLELQTVVQKATDAGLELCGAQFGAFFYNLVNEAGESYLLYTLSGVDREKFAKFPNPRNTAIFAPTFAGEGIVRSDDITQDPRYGHNAPHMGMPKGHLPVKSYLAVPVKSMSGEVLGGLFYGHEKTGIFTEATESFVANIAAQAAVAIDNVQLREQLTKKVRDLEKTEALQKDSAKKAGELAAIIASSDDAILSKDLTGHITSWNAAAERILGYTSEEIVGESILRLIPPDLHDDEKTIIENIKAGNRIEHFETVRLTKSGQPLDVSLSISPIRDGTGEIVGASKILRDISNRKRLEASLVQAEKIAATGRMAATIAHEINNPLEGLVNLLYLAKEKAIDSEQVEYLRAAESEVARVSHIAKQTLGYYRETTAATRTSLASLAADAVRFYEPKLRTAGIQLETNLESRRELLLRRGEVMQVISNLIANSIYAMPGGGKLSICVKDFSEPLDGVLLEVTDTGVGIPEKDLGRIFEAFFSTRSNIGTGIGLFVAKQLIEGQGGKIEVKSSTDMLRHGTTMAIYLPMTQ